MCFLCSGEPPVRDEFQDSKPSTAHEAGPGPGVFRLNPLPPSSEGQKQPKKVGKSEPFPMKYSESEGKPSPKKFSPNTTYVQSPSPAVNSDSDDTKDKKSRKTSSPDRKIASSETTYASNPLHSTDHFPKLNSDSDKPTTRKTGHESTYASNPLYSTDHFPKLINSDSDKPTTRKTGHESTYASNPLYSTNHFPKLINSDSDKPTTRKTGHESTYASNPLYSTDHFPKLINSDSDKPTTRKTGHESTYASNPLYSTDHFPKLINSDSDKPTTRKTGHESKLSPSPPPEKLKIKSTELSENITRRFPTSDDVTRNTTESPTKARDEQNAKASNTSSYNKKLMWNEKEHTGSPYKDAASSLHYQTAISDCEKDQNIPYW